MRCGRIAFIFFLASFAINAKADCTFPDAINGAIEYFENDEVLAYCVNDTWAVFDPGGLSAVQTLPEPKSKYLLDIAKSVTVGNQMIAIDTVLSKVGVIDVSNPQSANLVGTLESNAFNNPRALAVAGNYAYVGGEYTFSVVNISNPSSPTLVTTLIDQDYLLEPVELAVVGNVAYFLSSNAGLTTLDISNPAAPAILGSFYSSELSTASGLIIKGNHLITYSFDNTALVTLDISDPSSPYVANTFSDNFFTNGNNAITMILSGNGIFFAIDQHMAYLDATDPTNLSIAVTEYYLDGYATGLYFNNDQLIVGMAGELSQYIIYDVADLERPRMLFLGLLDSTISFTRSREGLYNPKISGNILWGVRRLYDTHLTPADTTYVSAEIVAVDLSPKNLISGFPIWSFNDGAGQNYQDVAWSGSYGVAVSETGQYVINLSAPNNPVFVTKFDLNNSLQDKPLSVAFTGTYAYIVTDRGRSIQVFNLSTPASPTYVKTVPTGLLLRAFSDGGSIRINGTKLLMAADSGFAILDISNPADPAGVSTFQPDTNSIVDFAISGNYVYLMYWMGTLKVLDISTPASPTQVGTLTDPSLEYSRAMTSLGNYLYIQNSDLVTVDISSPTSPSVATLTGANNHSSLLASGTKLYAQGDSTFEVYDLTNPTFPTVQDTINYGYSGSLVKQGNYILRIRSSNTLQTVNVANPANIVEGTPLEYQGSLQEPQSLATKGNYVFVGSFESVKVLDVSNPSSSSFVHSVSVPNFAYRLLVDGNNLIAATGGSVEVLDITNPTAAGVVGTLTNPVFSYANDLKKVGSYIYYLSRTSIEVLDISDPADPQILSTLPITDVDECSSMEIRGSYLYVSCEASNIGGLSIVDISSPASPSLVSRWDPSGGGSNGGFGFGNISIVGNYAYLMSEGFTLSVDLSNPTSPVLRDLFLAASKLVSANSKIYGLGFGGGLAQFDITNPARPAVYYVAPGPSYNAWVSDLVVVNNHIITVRPGANAVDIYDLSETNPFPNAAASVSNFKSDLGPAAFLTMQGNFLYSIGTAGGNLAIYNIATPSSPTVVSTMVSPLLKGASKIIVQGNDLYVMTGHSIDKIDVTNPASPSVTGSLMMSNRFFSNDMDANSTHLIISDGETVAALPLTAISLDGFFSAKTISGIGFNKIKVTGNILLACNFDGLSIFDISDLDNPVALFADGLVNNCESIEIQGNYAYLGSNGEVHIIDISDPSAPFSLSSVPNYNWGDIRKIKVIGNDLYASGSESISVFNISDKNNPQFSTVRYFSSPGGLAPFEASAGYIYQSESTGLVTYSMVTLPDLGSCTNPGAMGYDTTENVMFACLGSTFKAFGPSSAGGAGCTSPTASAGSLDFDAVSNNYRYCNGASWNTINRTYW